MAAESKKLAIYYSRADENYSVGYIKKGNTEIVAEIIAAKTGATLLKVEPVKEYPKVYDEWIAVAKKELAQEARLKKVTGANVTPGLAIYGHTAQNEKSKAEKDVEKWLK